MSLAWRTPLGIAFAAAGADKLAGDRGYDRAYASWGWGPRAVRLVGAGEVVGGLLLAVRARRTGAALLAATSAAVLQAELRRGAGEALPRFALLAAALLAFSAPDGA